jgi:hypothetical protein
VEIRGDKGTGEIGEIKGYDTYPHSLSPIFQQACDLALSVKDKFAIG